MILKIVKYAGHYVSEHKKDNDYPYSYTNAANR